MLSTDPSTTHAIDISRGEVYPILDVLTIGVLIANAAGEIVYYNRAHARMDGLPPRSVIGHRVTEVYDLDDHSSLVMRCLSTTRPIVDCPAIYKARRGPVVNSVHNVFPLIKHGNRFRGLGRIDRHQRRQPLLTGAVNVSDQPG